MAEPFAAALALGDDWREVADALGSRLAKAPGGLGLLYTAEAFAPHQGEMLAALQRRTGVEDWVSAAGYGVIGAGEEHYGASGAAVLLLDLPTDGYRLFAGGPEAGPELAATEPDWLAAAAMPLALTHVDPRRPDAVGAVERLAASTGGFLVGGLTAAAGDTSHQSGGATGTLSGVALSPAAVEIATALSQGCTPLGAPTRSPGGRTTSSSSSTVAARSTSSTRTSARSSPRICAGSAGSSSPPCPSPDPTPRTTRCGTSSGSTPGAGSSRSARRYPRAARCCSAGATARRR